MVLLLSLTGLLVGILQAYDQFTIPALAPAVWNLVVLAGLIGLRSVFHGQDQIYAYAVAWLIATWSSWGWWGEAMGKINLLGV